MYDSKDNCIATMARYFLQPDNAAHRQYEALRAYFVDGLPSAEAARRFGYQTAKSRHIFRDFVDASTTVEIGERTIDVQFQKRARNPLLIAAGYDRMDTPIPWLGGKRMRFVFG